MSSPVFHDLEQRRWHRFKRTTQLSGALLSIIFGVLIVSVVVNSVLPVLSLSLIEVLPQARHLAPPPPLPPKPAPPGGRKFQNAKSNLDEYLKKNQSVVLLVASPRPITKAELIGFYVAIKSTITAIRGTVMGWGKIERKATVQWHFYGKFCSSILR